RPDPARGSARPRMRRRRVSAGPEQGGGRASLGGWCRAYVAPPCDLGSAGLGSSPGAPSVNIVLAARPSLAVLHHRDVRRVLVLHALDVVAGVDVVNLAGH